MLPPVNVRTAMDDAYACESRKEFKQWVSEEGERKHLAVGFSAQAVSIVSSLLIYW